jgi:hypothetical protein
MIPGLIFCPMLHFSDYTNLPWTQKDQKALSIATKEGCKRRNPLEPCVYTFEKLDDGKYNVVCGPEKPHSEIFTDHQ